MIKHEKNQHSSSLYHFWGCLHPCLNHTMNADLNMIIKASTMRYLGNGALNSFFIIFSLLNPASPNFAETKINW